MFKHRLFLENEHSVMPIQLYGIVCQHISRPQQTLLPPSAGSKYTLLKSNFYTVNPQTCIE